MILRYKRKTNYVRKTSGLMKNEFYFWSGGENRFVCFGKLMKLWKVIELFEEKLGKFT